MANIQYLLVIFVLVIPAHGWFLKLKKTTKTKCYDLYGEKTCFSKAKPFTNSLGKLPESPSSQRISFSLYTPRNPQKSQSLTGNSLSSITDSRLDNSKMVRVIVHGFSDHGSKAWVKRMTSELIKRDGSNVIVVDWEKGADKSLLGYPQAVANTRVVGALLARLIRLISLKKGVSMGRFHLIGHSLGAHIAGYAGRRHRGRIGRISGLDPAGPSFEKQDVQVRLDRSDAMFVDVIHTNGKKLIKGGFGIQRECGDADFFPNGGQNQPGCSRKLVDHLKQLFKRGPSGFAASASCDHLRALVLYTESINSKCSFRACGKNGWSRMGFHASSSKRGRFNLKTRSSSKFCIQ